MKAIRNLVSGGAGFLGSHLIDRLMKNGEEVICLDNFYSGRKINVEKWLNNNNFELVRHDITIPINFEGSETHAPILSFESIVGKLDKSVFFTFSRVSKFKVLGLKSSMIDDRSL